MYIYISKGHYYLLVLSPNLEPAYNNIGSMRCHIYDIIGTSCKLATPYSSLRMRLAI